MIRKIAVLTITVASLTLAQWWPDVRLSVNDPFVSAMECSHGRAFALDGETLFVVWSDGRDGNTEVYCGRSLDGGMTWEPSTRLTIDPYNSNGAVLCVSGGLVHVVWYDSRDGNEEIYYKRSTDAGATWSGDVRLTNANSDSRNPSCCVSGTLIHLAWVDYRDGNGEIYYKRSSDMGTTWSPDTRLTNDAGSSGYPSICVDDSVVNVVWADNRDGNQEIYGKRSADNGSSWSADTRLTTDPYDSWYPSVVASGSVRHVVWQDYRNVNWEVYHKRSTDGGLTWDADIRITNDSGASEWPSAAASDSTVHIVWQDNRDGNYEMYNKLSTDGGTTWGADSRVTTDTARGWQSAVAVLNHSVHIVWNDNRDGHWEVFYKRTHSYDVSCTGIAEPTGTYLPEATVAPTAFWRNNGDTAATFTAWFVLLNPSLSRVYVESLPVSSLGSSQETTLVFPTFGIDSTGGRWYTRCSTSLTGDANATNDTMSGSFLVEAAPPWPDTWDTGEPVPTGVKAIKDGGWLVAGQSLTDAPRYIFAAKGNKTSEFYRYEVATGNWTPAAPIPIGREAKPPSKGCKAVADDYGFVYMTKGNNTQGFWQYNSANDSWTQMADVPLGSSNKRVKGGNDLAYYEKGGERYIYLVKGQKTGEFWRYKVSGDSWSPLQAVPVDLPALKTDAGSWLELVEAATDGHSYLYLHKSKFHHLHRYDLATEAWVEGRKTGMPFIGQLGKSKKSKDGGSATFWNGDIYALKGGNTCEFWKYSPAADQWLELDPIPEIEPTGNKKKVKAGGDVVSVGGGGFFVTKGNKTSTCWRIVVAEAKADGVMANRLAISVLPLSIAPNPLRAGFATVILAQGHDRIVGQSGSCPKLSIYDAAGRCVMSQAYCVGHQASSITIDLRSLSAGVYLVRQTAGGYSATQKFVIQR